MTSQSTQFHNLPKLSSPELDRLSSRLERGLLQLARLTAPETSDSPAEPASLPAETEPVLVAGVAVDLLASSDRRAFPRRDSSCRVAVCRLTSEDRSLNLQQMEWRLHATPLKGTLEDLSLKGAAILLPNQLSVGEDVVLRLFCPRRDRHLDQQATVVAIVADGDGFKAMCQFNKRLSLEQVTFFSRFLGETDWV
jgi:hypothetical protein